MMVGKLKEKEDFVKNFMTKPIESQDYELVMVPTNCPFVSVPNIITLWERNVLAKKNLIKKTEDDRKSAVDQDNKITITFHFKQPTKDFNFNIMIRNRYLTDIRIYRVLS